MMVLVLLQTVTIMKINTFLLDALIIVCSSSGCFSKIWGKNPVSDTKKAFSELQKVLLHCYKLLQKNDVVQYRQAFQRCFTNHKNTTHCNITVTK